MVGRKRGPREARVELQQRREARGLNQASLADLTDVAVRTVRAWEAGTNWPTTAYYPKIMAALGIDDVDDLLRLLDTPPRIDARPLCASDHRPDATTKPGILSRGYHPDAATDEGPVLSLNLSDFTSDSGRPDREVVAGISGGRFFTGTRIATKVFPACDDGRILAMIPTDFTSDSFLLRPRRALVIGVVRGESATDLFGLDARHARRRLAEVPGQERLLMSRAYALDDLTLGILWAVANLDDALLDDDAPLDHSRGRLIDYERLPRSQGGREIAADLTTVSRMWLGSKFCADHILRNADALTGSPAFWTREQRGEEASTWLLFSHKHDYLRRTGTVGGGHGTAVRGVCVPPEAVAVSARPERILLLLAIALMESFGITVTVTTDSDFARLPGFVSDGQRRAIVANWIGTEGIWQVDVTGAESSVREFADASGHVRAHSIVAADSPGERLRALADYLELDWSWLVRRCAELGECGTSGIAAPRSRLLSIDGVDRACRFLAATAAPLRR